METRINQKGQSTASEGGGPQQFLWQKCHCFCYFVYHYRNIL